jgi:lipopolysaccharide/colanic/teichoic acid biosynthesis glycosyltransferase
MNDMTKTMPSKKSWIFDSVLPREEFLEALKRERLRTHRTGLPFCLLIFRPHVGFSGIKVFEELFGIIIARVRATDVVGWYDINEVGVLLPDTLPEGAGMLAVDILSKRSGGHELICEVQSYPKITSTMITPTGKISSGMPMEIHPVAGDETSIITKNGEIEELFAPPMPRWKRALDILGAGLGLVATLPITLFVAALIKTVSPGPVLFKQVRLGFRKKPFVCLKFRTMKVQADTGFHENYMSVLIKNESESMRKLDDVDPRIIPFGRILRKTGLDELPQLVNILLGDMSLVGPRPCTIHEATQYRMWQHRRFDTKPGLTGLWQVSGKNRTSFVEMMRFDIGYSISKSLLKDLWIIIRTVPALCVQAFDRFPKRKDMRHEQSSEHRSGWLRVLGPKSDSKL